MTGVGAGLAACPFRPALLCPQAGALLPYYAANLVRHGGTTAHV